MIGSDYKKIITIGEHFIQQPALPTKKDKILFIDEKDGYWRRDLLIEDFRTIWWDFIPHITKIYQDASLYDQDGVLMSLNKEDSDYIVRTYEREIERRRDGVFMKNGSEIIWIPGDYYFVLMYCKTKRPDKKSEYFDFREYQNEDSILCNYVENSPHILGLATSKAKKTGITNLRWLYYLNKATMTKNINLANLNIDQDKGAKTFRDYFMYAYDNLVPAFKAKIKTKSEAEGRITFGKQYRNTKKALLMKNDSSDDLNTSVMCMPTLPHACDVDVFTLIWFDELVKVTKDCAEIYRSNMSGTSIQDDLVGKLWITNYTPEENSSSFTFCKQLFYDSELRTINESNGQTKSKLIWHHIPAYQSWSTSFDKYGKCDEADAMRKISAGREALKDRPRELQGEIRKYANTKKEAWSTGGAGSVFDNIRLSDILTNVEEEQRNSAELPYKEGRLVWTNSLWEIGGISKRPRGQFCPVQFVPLTKQELQAGDKGRLRIYNDVPRQMQNAVLKNGRDEWGCIIPPEIFFYTLGGDPTQYAAASEVIEGSKNAFIVKSRPDDRIDSLYRKVSSNRFDLVYFDRPELPAEAYEDLVKLIIYTGCIGIVEANVPMMATSLIEEGLGRFLLVRNEDGIIQQWARHLGLGHEPEKRYHLIRTTNNGADSRLILEQFVNLWKNYIQKPEEGGKDYGGTIKDERILEQLMNIDITNTKLFDLFMASGYALLADEIYTNLLLHQNDHVHADGDIASVLYALCG